jgi:hypothetical protein
LFEAKVRSPRRIQAGDGEPQSELGEPGQAVPLDLHVILRDELLRPSAETPRAQGTMHLGNARCHTRNKPTGSGSRSPGLKPLFEQERLAVEWFLIPSLVESHEGAVGLQLPSVDGVGELELEEAPDSVAASRLAQGEELLDPAVKVALHEVVGAAEADLLFLALPEGANARACSRKQPTSETTRMFPLIPSRPGLRQQMPRMMRSFLTPAHDAS